MLYPGIQEAGDELLVLGCQHADDLTHRRVVPRLARGRDHQVNVIAADVPFELGLLGVGDEAASVTGDADVVLGKAVSQRTGLRRRACQPGHGEHADYEHEEPSHVRNLPSPSRSHYVAARCDCAWLILAGATDGSRPTGRSRSPGVPAAGARPRGRVPG